MPGQVAGLATEEDWELWSLAALLVGLNGAQKATCHPSKERGWRKRSPQSAPSFRGVARLHPGSLSNNCESSDVLSRSSLRGSHPQREVRRRLLRRKTTNNHDRQCRGAETEASMRFSKETAVGERIYKEFTSQALPPPINLFHRPTSTTKPRTLTKPFINSLVTSMQISQAQRLVTVVFGQRGFLRQRSGIAGILLRSYGARHPSRS